MFLLVVKIVHLIGRTDLFKISNLVLVGQAIVTSLYNSLEGTERERERERETSRTRAGVHTSYGTGNNFTYMRANRNNVFKI